MNKNISYCLFFLCLLVFKQTTYAGVDNPIVTVLDGNKNQIAKDSSVTSVDSLFFSTSQSGNFIKPYPVKDVITFHINEQSLLMLPDSFKAVVHLKIIYIDSSNNVDSLNDLRLLINYKASSSYTARASFVFSGAYSVKIKVLNDTIASSVIGAMMIENEIIPSRLYTFSCPGKPDQAVNLVSATADELTVSWGNFNGIDEAELEWTFIDSSAIASGSYTKNGSLDPGLIFTNNATRIRVASLIYSIPLIFSGSGSVFVRVRGVQIRNNKRLVTSWSSDHLPGGMLRYDFSGHEKNLNWQSSVSFAEDGKRKVVVQYFDGSLRDRQTVTKDNTTNATITAENIYDYQGRPTIQVLPAPTINSIIQYTANFNKLNGAEYDKSSFDSLIYPNTACTLVAPAMDSSSGAAWYYSKNNSQSGSGVSRYIPQAYGYAFSQTEYTQDNTGRISRQGGVGQDFKLNSGHETKYYYSMTPDQNELDALFGTDAGDHTHYFKNAVRDANGQYSVSYVDMHGRTIATALAGHAPTGISKLSSNIPAVITQTLADANTNIIDGLSMISHKSLLVDMAGPQRFVYSLNPLNVQQSDCNSRTICYDCLYDLTITITDDCNNQKLGGHPLVINRPNITIADTLCNAPNITIDTTVTLDEGEYQITKTLTVNKTKQQEYYEKVFLPRNTCKSLTDFITKQQQTIPHGNCGLTCESCRASIGTLSDFTNNYMLNVYGDTTGKSMHQSEIQSAYNNALTSCDIYCNDTAYAGTDYVREAMLLDMSPKSGQYANLDSVQDIYSIFYKQYSSSIPIYQQITDYKNETGVLDSVFDNVTGIKVPPQQLDANQFAEDFKPAWASSLLSHHPEFCKYQAYQNYYSAYTWDKKFQAIKSYSEAITKGYYHPLASGASQDTLAIVALFSSSLSNKYNSYVTSTLNGNTKTLTMWQVAILNTKCPAGDTACIQNIVFNTQDYSLPCKGDSDQAWRNFQQLYSAYRTELLNNYYDGINCSVTAQQLLTDGHYLNFNTSGALINANGLAFTSSTNQQEIKDSAQAQMHAYYQNNCEAYKTIWTQQLLPGYTTSQVNQILPMLVDVCVAGADQDHPFGSRDISANTSSISEIINGQQHYVRSFDDIIDSYNTAYSITKTITRNADVITQPLPYNAPAVYTKPIISRPDTSECGKILYYHSLYVNYCYRDINTGAPLETFSQFLKRAENIDISDQDLQTLLNSCSGTTSCNYFVHPINLPTIFQANVGSACTSCGAFNSLFTEFTTKYGDSCYPVITNQSDTLQQKKNQLFTNFMNTRLGYNLNITDYLNFKHQCDSQRVYPYNSPPQTQAYPLNCDHWVKLAGSNSGIHIGHLEVYGDSITVEALFNASSGDVGGDLVSKHTGPWDVNYLLRTYQGAITTTTGFYQANQPCQFDTNRTYHVALVYDGQSLKFYRDGYLVSQVACTGDLVTNTNLPTWIGAETKSNYNEYVNEFKGYINEVRIWSVARTQDQIRQYMTSSLPNPTTQTGLSAYYVFDNLQNKLGNTQYDGIFNNSLSSINQTNPECIIYAATSCPVFDSGAMLCGKSQPAFPLIAMDTVNSCTDSTFFAVSTGTELYKNYQDSLKNNFDSLYFSKCLNAYKYEAFTVTDSLSEYQYTLYYYDQAGNLVQTIPPRAVRPNWNTTYLSQVKVKRASGDTLRPGHDLTLVTNYRYNTLNQVISQKTPDAGNSSFFYDRLGRLVLSKNAKQTPLSKYSYTTYDPLGRITEVGELTNASTMNTSVSKSPTQLQSWLTTANNSRTQITHTAYDTVYYGAVSQMLVAKNLRNRVSYVQYFNTAADQNYPKPKAGTFYSYDIEGNVDTLVQDFVISSLDSLHNRFFKKIVYQYDLISGKVNAVAYNPNQPDAFYHRYTYDAENRLTNVETSIDSIYWENEAFYKYYYHGPLARTVLGELQIQGVDFAYTLQGWLKGINSSASGTTFDMGGDGYSIPFAANQYVGRDAFGFALHYFGKDYNAISNLVLPFAKVDTSVLADFKPLYNGNIAAISQDVDAVGKVLLYNYSYDQLNRLIQMRTYKNASGNFALTNKWSPGSIYDYNEDVTYDPNGNIQKYRRYGASSNGILNNAKPIDSLNYFYESKTNRLDWIKDSVPTATTDIATQSSDNYGYDSIGNLIRDNKEGIDSISWTVYGKIQKINKHNGTVISYSYDAAGNRLSKVITGATSGNGETWYVHDATGNIMSIYTVNNSTVNNGALTLSEQNVYGSSRLGIYAPALNLNTYNRPLTYMNRLGVVGYNSSFVRGQKLFELSNHLGNVLVTVSDKKLGVYNGNGAFNYYTADVVSAQDYYPGGMLMPSRIYNVNNSAYRYGFNGKERDSTITNQDYDYGFRVYDARTVRFLSVDPLQKKYPYYSPFQFAGNSPIRYIDLDGLEPENNPKAPGANESRAMTEVSLIETNTARNDAEDNIFSKGSWLSRDNDIKGVYSCGPNGKWVTDTKGDPENKFNMYVNNGATLNVDESQSSHFNNYEAFITHRLMTNFVSGEGAENYNFPTNGIISNKFLGSDVLKDALSKYKTGEIKDGQTYQSPFGGKQLANDILKTGTMFSSITGFVGSATITIKKTDANMLQITIFNVTSLTSGDLWKALWVEKDQTNWPKSYARDPEKITPFGNISQTYNLLIPNPVK